MRGNRQFHFADIHTHTHTHTHTLLAFTTIQHVIMYQMLPAASIFLEQSISLRRDALVNSQNQVLNSKSMVKTGKDTVLLLFLQMVSTKVRTANYPPFWQFFALSPVSLLSTASCSRRLDCRGFRS